MQGKKFFFNSLHRELTNVHKFILLFLHVYMFVICTHASIHVPMCVGAHVSVGALHVCMCAYAWRGQRLTMGIFLVSCLPYTKR